MGRHLSYSQVSLYLGCSYKWRLQYLDKAPRDRPKPSLRIGTAVHNAMEVWGKAKIEGREVCLTDPHLDTALERGVAPQCDLYPRARYLTRELLAKAAEHLTPKAVELPFSVPLGYGDWTFDGRIDAVSKNDVIIDWKTATKPWRRCPEHTENPKAELPGCACEEHASQQPNAYYFAWHALTGAYPKGFLFVVVSDDIEVKVEDRRTDRDADGARGFQALAIDVAQAIERGEFKPNPEYQWCHACRYREPGTLLCPEFQAG